jgi:orotate phosphoribosyltransferase
LVLETLDDKVVAVGGLTMGADPVAVSVSLVSGRLSWFSVRKQPKSHGQKRMIEGDIPGGAMVAVVDDVVTTGGSTVEAITKCREAGMKVAQVVIVVDREEAGGLARIQREAGPDVPTTALFTKTEVADQWRALGGPARKTV